MLRSTEFSNWDPGRRVTFVVAPPEPLEWVVIMVIYGALFGSMSGYALMVGFNDFVSDTTMSYIEAFVLCAIPISIVGAMHLAGGDQTEGTLDIDWEREQMSVARKFTKRTFPLSQLSNLVARAEFELRGGGGPDSTTEAGKERVHNACLYGVFPRTRVLILSTDSRDLVEQSAVHEILSVAEPLARHLNVELVEEAPKRRAHKGFLRALVAAPWWMWLSMVGLTLLSCAWVCWRAGTIGT